MLRPATEADVDVMLAWRNQDANRSVSVTDHIISEPEHRAWWRRTSEDPTRMVMVFESGHRACGVVSYFDLETDQKTASWGFFLDHDGLTEDGTVLTAWMAVMREATDFAFGDLGLDRLTGEVQEENAAVRQLNRRFGLVEDPSRRRVEGGRTFIPISLSRDEHDRRALRRRAQR